VLKPGPVAGRTIEEARRYFGTMLIFTSMVATIDRPTLNVITYVDDAIEVLRQGAVIFRKTKVRDDNR